MTYVKLKTEVRVKGHEDRRMGSAGGHRVVHHQRNGAHGRILRGCDPRPLGNREPRSSCPRRGLRRGCQSDPREPRHLCQGSEHRSQHFPLQSGWKCCEWTVAQCDVNRSGSGLQWPV